MKHRLAAYACLAVGFALLVVGVMLDDEVDLLEMALGDDMFLRVQLDGTSGEDAAINPHHVLYVREVAE